MGKLFTRLVVTILAGLCVYLYVQVVQLQRANKAMAASLNQLQTMRTDNARLRLQLAEASAPRPANVPRSGWLSEARGDLQSAGQAIERGDFTQAATDSRQASERVGSAARQTAQRSRNAAAALHERLVAMRSRAQELVHSFGG